MVRTISVKAGQFVDIPFGTLHAFGGGVTLIEFSQNADLTYRLFDYDRIDAILGTQRQLNVQAVLDNVRIPNSDTDTADLHPVHKDGLTFTMLHDESGVYTAAKLEIDSKAEFNLSEFYFMTVLEGNGKLNGTDVKAGETWFIPCYFGPLHIEGELVLVYVSYRKKEKS